MNTQIMDGVVGYCRLSDEDERFTESRSIETQRNIIKRYAQERGWEVKHFYVDDGNSGTNFERPAYQEMKEDIENGEVKCVIVKDLSRFGRNAAKMTIELEHFNDECGLRFISISEDIDAESTNDYNEIFQIVLVLNEMYPRDCSKKIKASWHNGVSDGKFMFGTPPFGYQRGDENNLCLTVDTVAAKLVKRIFEAFATGDNMRQIAEMLNQEGIPSPRAYYYQKVGRTNPKAESSTWGSNTIRQMLDNEAYIGILVQGKRRAVSYKNKKRKLVPSENWYRTEHTHEAIIDDITWAEVRRRKEKKSLSIRRNGKSAGVFSGLLRCGNCGAALAHTLARDKPIYRCSLYNNNGRTACTPHSISEETLMQIVGEDIRKYAHVAHENRERLVNQLLLSLQKENGDSSRILSTQKRNVENSIQLNQRATKRLLEDRAQGYMPDNIFHPQIQQFSTELDTLRNELQETQNKMEQKNSEQKNISCWLERIEKHLKLERVDRIVATELIESILVYERISHEGQKIFDISLKYRFVGCLDETKKALPDATGSASSPQLRRPLVQS